MSARAITELEIPHEGWFRVGDIFPDLVKTLPPGAESWVVPLADKIGGPVVQVVRVMNDRNYAFFIEHPKAKLVPFPNEMADELYRVAKAWVDREQA